jgi:hypothetical protein
MMTEAYTPSNTGSQSPLQPNRFIGHSPSAGQLSGHSNVHSDHSGGTLGYNYHNASIDRQPSSFAVAAAEMQQNYQNRPTDSSESNGGSDSGPGVDIQALASEVAKVLKNQNVSTKENTQGNGERERRNDHPVSDGRSVSESVLTAPPRYHTVNNTTEE